jgi:hypothetical protein
MNETLAAQAFEPLAEGSGRVMVLQLDGVMVLGQVDKQPDAEAACEAEALTFQGDEATVITGLKTCSFLPL